MTPPPDPGPPSAPLHGYADPDAPRPPRPGAYPPPRSSPPPSAPPEPPTPRAGAAPPSTPPTRGPARDHSPPRPGGPRRLNQPQPARVRAGEGGRPLAVDGHEVDAVRESWLIEDRWWTDAPLRRRYWEIVTVDGRCWVVFRELEGGAWYRQR